MGRPRSSWSKPAPLLERVGQANEVGAYSGQTLGTVWAIARGATNDEAYLLDHSVVELCTALMLRGFDVKVKTPAPEVISRRCGKARRRMERANG